MDSENLNRDRSSSLSLFVDSTGQLAEALNGVLPTSLSVELYRPVPELHLQLPAWDAFNQSTEDTGLSLAYTPYGLFVSTKLMRWRSSSFRLPASFNSSNSIITGSSGPSYESNPNHMALGTSSTSYTNSHNDKVQYPFAFSPENGHTPIPLPTSDYPSYMPPFHSDSQQHLSTNSSLSFNSTVSVDHTSQQYNIAPLETSLWSTSGDVSGGPVQTDAIISVMHHYTDSRTLAPDGDPHYGNNRDFLGGNTSDNGSLGMPSIPWPSASSLSAELGNSLYLDSGGQFSEAGNSVNMAHYRDRHVQSSVGALRSPTYTSTTALRHSPYSLPVSAAPTRSPVPSLPSAPAGFYAFGNRPGRIRGARSGCWTCRIRYKVGLRPELYRSRRSDRALPLGLPWSGSPGWCLQCLRRLQHAVYSRI